MKKYRVKICTLIGNNYTESIKTVNREELEEIKRMVFDIEHVGYFAHYDIIEEVMV